jgi:hypothetical protein
MSRKIISKANLVIKLNNKKIRKYIIAITEKKLVFKIYIFILDKYSVWN